MKFKITDLLQIGLLLAFGFIFIVANAQEPSRSLTTDPDMKQMLDRMENEADIFEDKFDAALDQSSLNGSVLEYQLNSLVGTMEDVVDNMAEEYNEKDTEKFIDELETSLIAASGVNRAMRINDMSAAASQWESLRRDLNHVAQKYHRPGLPNVTVVTLIPVTWETLGRPELQLTMERIEAASDRFEETFHDSIYSSTINSEPRRQMFTRWGLDLEYATDEMLEQYKEKDYKEFSSRLEQTLVLAEVINRVVLRSDLSERTELEWTQLREDLNTLALAFGQPVLPSVVNGRTSTR